MAQTPLLDLSPENASFSLESAPFCSREQSSRELRLPCTGWAIQDQDLLAWLHGLHYRGQPLRRGGPYGDFFLKTLSTGRLSGLDHVVHQGPVGFGASIPGLPTGGPGLCRNESTPFLASW